MTMNNFFQGPPGPGGERGDTGNPGVVVRFKCKLHIYLLLRIIFLQYMTDLRENMYVLNASYTLSIAKNNIPTIYIDVVCIIDDIKYLEKILFETWPQNLFGLWHKYQIYLVHIETKTDETIIKEFYI